VDAVDYLCIVSLCVYRVCGCCELLVILVLVVLTKMKYAVLRSLSVLLLVN